MDENINEEKLKQLQNELKKGELLIIKFTADWCAPCKGIKPICDEFVKKIPESIKFFEIDIDESIELYMKLKKYKSVIGIPAILAFKPIERDNWFSCDDCVLNGNKDEVVSFLNRCITYLNQSTD